MTDDDLIAVLAELRMHDVSGRRSSQLRRRCHAILTGEPSSRRSAWVFGRAAIRRVLVPALGGAWCLAYIVEIIRRTAAVYGYFGTQ
jgi:hypothetical protein